MKRDVDEMSSIDPLMYFSPRTKLTYTVKGPEWIQRIDAIHLLNSQQIVTALTGTEGVALDSLNKETFFPRRLSNCQLGTFWKSLSFVMDQLRVKLVTLL